MIFIGEDNIKRYLGKWEARVLKTEADDRKQGRLRLLIPDVLGAVPSKLALPSFPPNRFSVPPVGTQVWVEFLNGDVNRPVWTGVVYSSAEGAQAAAASMVGDDDETVAFGIGKGGSAVVVTDPNDESVERTISEPVTLSKPKYPYVESIRVGSTLIEIDGTPDAERIHLYHRSGAYYEIGPTGQIHKLSKGTEHDWAKGSRSRVTVGPLVEAVEGNYQLEVKKDSYIRRRADFSHTINGSHTEVVGSAKTMLVGGGHTVEVLGLETRSVGALVDTVAGNRGETTMGTKTQNITGAKIVSIANQDFASGQTVGLSYTVALGDIEIEATTGNFKFAGPVGTIEMSQLGDFKFSNAVGEVSMDKAGAFTAKNAAGEVTLDATGLLKLAGAGGSISLLQLLDDILTALINPAQVVTALGPQPLAALGQLTTVKGQLASIKG